MKKIIFLIFCIKLNAQQCRVIYKVVPTFGSLETLTDVKPENLAFMQNYVIGADETLKNMYYNLIVKDGSTSFEIDDKKLNAKPNYLALASANDDPFYTKRDTLYRVKKLGSQKIAIVLKKLNRWILFNEKKTINGYVCLKAQIEMPWRSGSPNDGKSTYFVTAWYCPKIPLKYGPKSFGNLPGLILELQDKKVTFQAISVDFNNIPEIKSDYFKKFKIISEEKYYEEVSEIAKSLNYSK
jgi:GLPGLI family protein